jgi:hypothetical protein
VDSLPQAANGRFVAAIRRSDGRHFGDLGAIAGAGSPILKAGFAVKSPAQEGEMNANQAAMPIGPIKDLRRLLSVIIGL